jgi:hypothetical protein
MNKSPLPRAEEWHQIVEGQKSSGLTVAAYCLERGISEGSFYTWKKRLRPPAKPKRLSKPAFVEVTAATANTAGPIEIGLHGERRLLVRRGFDRELLIELIGALEGIA